MTTYKEQRAALIAKSKAVIKAADDAGRDLTADEVGTLNINVAKVNKLDADHNRAGAKVTVGDGKGGTGQVSTSEALKHLGSPSHPAPATGQKVYRDVRPKAIRKTANTLANDLLGKAHTKDDGTLGNLATTTQILFNNEPVVEDDSITPSLLQLIGQQQITGNKYGYVRVHPLDNQAAVVPTGELKPTSTITAEDVEGDLSVIAHVTQPIDEYWMSDHPEVVAVYNNAMLQGLLEKQEEFLLNGDGQGGNPLGILNTDGIQSQAFSGDLLTTTRKALTKLELENMNSDLFVFNPNDWETLELSRTTSGDLEFTEGPVNRAEHKLWGVPVAVSERVDPGMALLLDAASAYLITDGAINVTTTGAVGDDFMHNAIRMRVEHRFGVAVTYPAGVVRIGLGSGDSPAGE